MAGCKFWKAELYRQCQQIAHSFAYKAFAEGWQSVEVVQAFACLTYWKEPDDTVSSPISSSRGWSTESHRSEPGHISDMYVVATPRASINVEVY